MILTHVQFTGQQIKIIIIIWFLIINFVLSTNTVK
jgi:hypothetical protein